MSSRLRGFDQLFSLGLVLVIAFFVVSGWVAHQNIRTIRQGQRATYFCPHCQKP